ncbi:MAG: sulfide:quinone oxidoreductase [Myxococcota bacterium]|jgi:sulfide:quinone oxidoreductase
MNPVKCAGARQKIMWLAELHVEKNGFRWNIEINYASTAVGISGIKRYADTLNQRVKQCDVHTRYPLNRTAVRAEEKESLFTIMATQEEVVMDCDMSHVTSPQSAPDFIKTSPLAYDAGWVDVDVCTTEHVHYANVFSIGDTSSLPNSKTAAAVHKQGPDCAQNIFAFRAGKTLTAAYDGYASCSLVAGYARLNPT